MNESMRCERSEIDCDGKAPVKWIVRLYLCRGHGGNRITTVLKPAKGWIQDPTEPTGTITIESVVQPSKYKTQDRSAVGVTTSSITTDHLR